MPTTVELIHTRYNRASSAASRSGFPDSLGSTMENAEQQGFHHAECVKLALALGFERDDVLAWVAGRRFFARRSAQGQLAAA